MDWLIGIAAGAAFLVVRRQYQQARIGLLGRHLAQYQVEKHLKTLHEGYMRALREDDLVRRAQIWELFAPTEKALATQVQQMAAGVEREPEQLTRIAKTAVCIPYLERFFPAATRDFRALMRIHAAGIAHAVENPGQLSAQDRAYQLMAEMLLMQHSCHWYCKSRNVANARLMVRHQVDYAKVQDSVSPQTRSSYQLWLET